MGLIGILLEHLGAIDNRWKKALPLASAVVFTMLGTGTTINGLVAYVG
jgi:hypothetical protein